MVKTEELGTKVKVLKGKISEAAKREKPNPLEIRALRKNLKRAQRKIRFMTGKKLTVSQKKTGEPTAAATPAQTATSGTPPATTEKK